VLDPVPNEILDELLETAAVGSDPLVRLYYQRRVVSLDSFPAHLGECLQRDRFHLAHVVSLASQRQEVVDQRIHPVERVRSGFDVVTVTLLVS